MRTVTARLALLVTLVAAAPGVARNRPPMRADTRHRPCSRRHRAAHPLKHSRLLTLVATGYCPCRRCCGRRAHGRTATGRSAWSPGVAISRGGGALRLGSLIPIAGYGTAQVDDTGRFGGGTIDLRFTTHRRAEAWGRRRVRVLLVSR